MDGIIPSHWDGDTLCCVEHYDWPQPHLTHISATKCDPLLPDCMYWVAVDGECYGFNQTKETCIASIESMLREAGCRACYVTFSLKNRTAGTWKRWVQKWSKRTIGEIPMFDASVRVSNPELSL